MMQEGDRPNFWQLERLSRGLRQQERRERRRRRSRRVGGGSTRKISADVSAGSIFKKEHKLLSIR